MDLRRVILRVLLVSLGLAAVCGVLAVLLASSDALGRTSGTCLMTAAAAGLMLPLTVLLDRPQLRASALTGMVTITAIYILVLAVIWVERAFGWPWEDELLVTALMTAVVGAAASNLVRLLHAPRTRLAGFAGLALDAGAAFFFAVATWFDPPHEDSWWLAGWSTFGVAAPIVACLVPPAEGRRAWRWIGVAAALVVLGVAQWHAWIEHLDEDVATPPITLALAVAFAHLLMLVPLRAGQRWLRAGTILSAAGLAVMVNVLVLGDVRAADGILGRVTAAFAIASGCGALGIVVLMAVNRRSRGIEAVEDIAVELVCPRCRERQEIRAGDGACRACGLRIRLRVEEPCCAQCGYRLYGLTAERCPECGTAVRKEARP